MAELVFLIAPPRSGTTALRSALSRGSDLANAGEIFDESKSHKGYERFFHWRADKFAQDPLLSIPTADNVLALWNDYLRLIHDQTQNAIALIDVKYSSLRSLDTIWCFPHAHPYLIKDIRARGFKVILLWRNDLARLVMSLMLAGSTGRYAHRDKSAIDVSIEVDEQAFEYELTMILKAKMAVFEFFADHDQILHLQYEDLFNADGVLNDSSIDRLSQFLGQPIVAAENEFVRTPVDYRSAITNYDRLVAIGQKVIAETPGANT